MGKHFTAAHQATINDNPIRCRFTLHAQCQETVGHDLDTVGLFDSQLLSTAQYRAALGTGGRNKQHRELIDSQRHQRFGNFDPF